MKDKNLLDDIKNKSLQELTELANNIIKNLENTKNLEDSMDEYQNLIRLNNLIEQLANTPAEIARPSYKPYEYMEQNVEAKKNEC